jgi:hypothetical protein
MDQPDLNASSARQLAELLALAFTAPPAPESPVHEQRLGEYQLLRKLGEGGMGTVYQARHTELDRLVAIKVLRPGRLAEADAAARFRREIKLSGRLDHPHLVRALDARAVGDTHFLVTEYVDGLDLQTLSDRLGRLPVSDACEIIRQAASGLQYAHEHGLVHRDVKPSNLMLNRDGQVKILDLGLARVVGATSASQQVTAIGQVVGTPDYIAPEQVGDSRGADIRADVYSLGCTLYTLLAGRPPYSGARYRDAWDKIEGQLHHPVPAIRRLRPEVPRGVAGVLARMVAKDRAQRFATPGEVAAALAPFTDQAALPRLLAQAEGRDAAALPRPRTVARDVRETRSAGPPPRRLRGARARRWAAVIAGVLLLAVAGATFWTWWNMGRTPVDEAPSRAIEVDREPLPHTSKTPATEPMVGWIVLSWNRPRLGKPDLWLFRADGQRRVNVTQEPQYFHIQPKFSPDGRHIAFIRGTEPLAPTELWVCRADGSDRRRLVSPQGTSERLAAPAWLSQTRIGYSRDPVLDRAPDVEFWQVGLDGEPPRRLFRFQDAFGEGSGVVTDVSPDGRQLTAIVQTEAQPATADVFLCDVLGQGAQPLWKDADDDRKDGRALWSHDGRRIAWQHQFNASAGMELARYGVGLARLGADGKWSAELPPPGDGAVVPLAWAPRGAGLLCLRIHTPGLRASAATLCCLDDCSETTRPLFDLEPAFWLSAHRDLGRLGDWAIVPDDAIPAGTEAQPVRPEETNRP